MRSFVAANVLFLILAGCIIPDGNADEVADANLISHAVLRYIEYQQCWEWHRGFRNGSTAPYQAVINKKTGAFVVRSDDVEAIANYKMRYLYLGEIRNDQAIIQGFEAYEMANSVPNLVIDAKYDHFSGDIHLNGMVVVPEKCYYATRNDTKIKTAMMAAVIRTITEIMNDANKTRSEIGSGGKVSGKLDLYIANFDEDYPSTLVYVAPVRSVYEVNFDDYFDGPPGDTATYATNDLTGYIQDNNDQTVERIMRHSVRIEINLKTDP